ncbi:MAG: hypothetical protein JSR59_21830 [Proteobacteria bacterium]|nr:hypothetical protein [Pseudomonadota bacterium]
MTGFLKTLFAKDRPRELIARATVQKALVDALGPPLLAAGFGHFTAGRALRHTEHWTDVIQIRFVKPAHLPGNSPSLHLGRHLDFVPEDAIGGPMPMKEGHPDPKEDQCQLRKTLYKRTRQRETSSANVWYIGGDIGQLAACAAEWTKAIDDEILPWFAQFDCWDALLELLLTGQPDIEHHSRDRVFSGTWNFGNYFSRHVVAGLVALQAGHNDVAVQRLEKALHDGGVVGKEGRVFPLPPVTIIQIRQALEKARA